MNSIVGWKVDFVLPKSILFVTNHLQNERKLNNSINFCSRLNKFYDGIICLP